jgi:hypothetical protein
MADGQSFTNDPKKNAGMERDAYFVAGPRLNRTEFSRDQNFWLSKANGFEILPATRRL